MELIETLRSKIAFLEKEVDRYREGELALREWTDWAYDNCRCGGIRFRESGWAALDAANRAHAEGK